MNDALGDRMKNQYEDRTRLLLPRRTYTIIRVDGKAFHSFTAYSHCERPFDKQLMGLMDDTAKALCQQIQGAKFAYVQSDEISILLTDFEKPTTEAFFDGNIQKITSVAASIATATFNRQLQKLAEVTGDKLKFHNKAGNLLTALFDARVFTIPDPVEVANYFIWRQQDASRNSVQMVARSLYSHKELDGKNMAEMHDLMFAQGVNWNDLPATHKRGRLVARVQNAEQQNLPWPVLPPPVFTQEPEFLKNLIPTMGGTNGT